VYSAEFKISVIMDMREHHFGYSETVRKYLNIMKGQDQNYKNTVIRWERIYLEEGAEGLMKERRGRSCSAGGTKKADRLN
jgi:transposase